MQEYMCHLYETNDKYLLITRRDNTTGLYTNLLSRKNLPGSGDDFSVKYRPDKDEGRLKLYF